MSITTGKRGDTMVVGVNGRLTVENRLELKQKVLDELERGEKKFLIDFAQTGYIDSSGLGALVSLSKRIREQRGELRLANLNDDLKTLFELTKLNQLFRISGDGGEGSAGAGVGAPVPPPRPAGGHANLSAERGEP